MAEEGRQQLDKVFKALGHATRRRILQLIAQNPRYAYELSKVLDLNRRVVLKHLEALEEAGLIQQHPGSSDVGPDRRYYGLSVSFGLSTTILPNAFFVGFTRADTIRLGDEDAVSVRDRIGIENIRMLLSRLERVDLRLKDLEDERMRLTALRGRLVAQIERTMHECSLDRQVCQQIRSLIEPIEDINLLGDSREPIESIRQAISLIDEIIRKMTTDCVANHESDCERRPR
ncbi:MAG: helix-turn-helix domain-containing protein [Candidatus Thorarchaeota archaeon]